MALDAGSPASGARFAVLAGLLSLLTLAVFLPVLGHEWLNYDDDVYITANPALRLGLSRAGITWAFSTFYGANWFPLTWLSWLADYQLHGLDPSGFHATNLALHLLAVLALFFAFVRLTGSLGRSAFVAGVFAVHPLHVEPVAWAAGRKDPLSGLFFALALLLYERAARRTSRGWQVGLFVCLLLGLMAKPTLVTLPCVLLLLDDWPLARLRRRDDPQRWDPVRVRAAVREKLPLFALVAVASAVAWAAQSSAGMVASLDRLPLGARIENALVAYAGYLFESLWPVGLAPIYPHASGGLPLWQPLLAAALLIGLSVGALAARGRPYLAVGWLWYLGTLVPTIGLVQVGSQAMADRYMYLPLIGLAVAAAWGVSDLLGRRLRTGLAVAVLAALGATSAAQLRHWRSSEALFSHALEVTRDNSIAHAQLGDALLRRGAAADGIAHYREALRIRPDYLDVANNLAWLLATAEEEALRDPPEAVRLAEATARERPADAAVLDTLAAAYAASGRFREARRTLARALALARQQKQPELAARLRTRAALYGSERAYREPVVAPAWRRPHE